MPGTTAAASATALRSDRTSGPGRPVSAIRSASQYPYLAVPDVTIASASAPRAVQVALLWALAGGGVLLFPALAVLFRVFKGERPFSVVDRPR